MWKEIEYTGSNNTGSNRGSDNWRSNNRGTYHGGRTDIGNLCGDMVMSQMIKLHPILDLWDSDLGTKIVRYKVNRDENGYPVSLEYDRVVFERDIELL